jgi:hypothetical protein
MVKFDRKLLDDRIGGLDRDRFLECSNNAEALTIELIEKHLALYRTIDWEARRDAALHVAAVGPPAAQAVRRFSFATIIDILREIPPLVSACN